MYYQLIKIYQLHIQYIKNFRFSILYSQGHKLNSPKKFHYRNGQASINMKVMVIFKLRNTKYIKQLYQSILSIIFHIRCMYWQQNLGYSQNYSLFKNYFYYIEIIILYITCAGCRSSLTFFAIRIALKAILTFI